MRIGLFTDSYLPSVNGVTVVVQIMKKQLEAMGHEVFVFCPAENIRPVRKSKREDHVVRFPSIQDVFYDDYGLAFFYPPNELRKIKKLNLDVIQILTPGQVGMMGIYAAQKLKTILVMQHSTDLAQYIQHYPGVVPGLLVLALSFPATFRFKGKDVRELLKIYRPRLSRTKWGRDIIVSLIAMIYSRTDAVIAVSDKSKAQLESWRSVYHYDVQTIPTGIDALPVPTKAELKAFKEKYGIADDDEVILYVGRLAAEKNLDILLPSMRRILRTHPKARLLFVGDFEYRHVLEAKTRRSGFKHRVTFTGNIDREELGVAYAVGDIFAFPSFTDTQGLVLTEAAHAALPFVLVDPELSEVVIDGKNGIIAQNTVASIAEAILKLLDDDELRAKYGKESKKLANQYTEFAQTKKLEAIYLQALADRKKQSKKSK